MKPCGIRIWTNQLQQTKDFYTKTLPFEIKVDGSKDGWFVVGTPTIDLIIELDDGAESSRYLGASFQVEDIHDTYRELCEKGVEFNGAPKQQEWGGWLVGFKDNTGNVWTVVQNG